MSSRRFSGGGGGGYSGGGFRGGGFGGMQLAMPGPPPVDILWLLGVLFVTYALDAFVAGKALVSMLQMTSLAWSRGFLWQPLTYPFAADFTGLWFLLSGLIIWWFGGDVFRALGRKRFWTVFLSATVGGGVAAALVDATLHALGGATAYPFVLMQGTQVVAAVLIVAFAALFANATILLIVLPIRAGWFLWIEIAFVVVGFLSTKDFPGFVGMLLVIGITYWSVTGDGPLRRLDRLRLRLRHWWISRQMKQRRGKSGLRLVDDESDGPTRGPWVH
ncbi:MAG: hypothetical protein AAGC60_04465 [Acidobacteriota bacterium]